MNTQFNNTLAQPDNVSGQNLTAWPRIAILLCTFNGQKYLKDQLDSFARQTYPNWEVWVSDDGSRDSTHDILESYQKVWGAEKLRIFSGPKKGFVKNFLSMVCKEDLHADFYAFSDQDDIWEPDKLIRAYEFLKAAPGNVPALYCSRTRLVDANNREIGLSLLFKKSPGFGNALVQNIGGGNTMMFNEATHSLLREAGTDIKVPIHDWWTYILVTGSGGNIFYDSYASLRYRQHGGNLVGMNTSWPSRFVRIQRMMQGFYKRINDDNITALHKVRHRLTPKNALILERFEKARKSWFVPRIIGVFRSGVYRQTFMQNLGLIAATLFKKI